MTSDTFGGHVVGCADEGVGIALRAEFSADTEIAEFDLAVTANENVGRLDVCGSLVLRSLCTSGAWFVPRWIIFRL